MNAPMKPLLVIVIIMVLPFAGCKKNSPPLAPSDPPPSSIFSFENDMEGWVVRGTDLVLAGDREIAWSIDRSCEVVHDGKYSLRLYLENLNDAGKIWIERRFTVMPNVRYHVNVKFAFASQDYGSVNLWRIIAGVLPRSPQTRDDLIYQGDTGISADTGPGFMWLEKSYDFDATSASRGELFVILGIWGTYETPRTYYLDAVQVTFTRER